MILSKDEVNFYNEKGYLLVEDVITTNQHNEMLNLVKDFFEKSKSVNENNNIFDLEDGHCATSPRLKRIKQPHQHSDFFWDIIKQSKIEGILIDLLGKDISLKTSKLNTKAPGGGAAVEWHQDWAFYPHTNDNVLALGLMLNDVDIDNGPLMVIPESHKGPVLSHNNNGVFCGAINPDDKFFDIDKAVTLTGKARSMTIHHARTLHGSAPNNSEKDRLVLFYECNSADAWPLVGVGAYLNNNGPIELCKQLEKQMVCGEVSYQPRMESVPVIIPLPPAPDHGSIFTTQKTGGAKSAF
jgi:ectoine hydroxylase-related dioxygenase (phytanoyl-CoA dioxygenase family)|tara:strand:+ start:3836 stop:4726 length:891 start_codon:yes stop_codon:yes gene_type:complete